MSQTRSFTPCVPADAPSPDWRIIDAIENLHPRGEHLSYAKAVWQGFYGRNGQKNGRWVVTQVVPANATPVTVLHEDMSIVKHPKTGAWMPKPGNELMLDMDELDDGQQKVFLETGRYSRPVLVVQGGRGGHKPFLSDAETRLIKTRGGNPHITRLGAKPFAPLSEKTIERLHELDATYNWRLTMDMRERTPEMFEQDEQVALAALESQFDTWLHEHVELAVESSGVSMSDLVQAIRSSNPTQ